MTTPSAQCVACSRVSVSIECHACHSRATCTPLVSQPTAVRDQVTHYLRDTLRATLITDHRFDYRVRCASGDIAICYDQPGHFIPLGIETESWLALRQLKMEHQEAALAEGILVRRLDYNYPDPLGWIAVALASSDRLLVSTPALYPPAKEEVKTIAPGDQKIATTTEVKAVAPPPRRRPTPIQTAPGGPTVSSMVRAQSSRPLARTCTFTEMRKDVRFSCSKSTTSADQRCYMHPLRN